MAYTMLFGGVVYFHGWVKPAMRELRHQVNTLSRERRILMYKIEFMEELRALEDTLRMRRKGMYTVSNLHMLFFCKQHLTHTFFKIQDL